MEVYRITKAEFASDLSGTGSMIYGGRWNEKGIACLYTSQNRALCFCEFLMNTPFEFLPTSVSLVTFNFEGMAQSVIKPEELPDNWQQYPGPKQLKKIGSIKLAIEKVSSIKVPSVLIPDEYNYIFNPLHSDYKNLKINKIETIYLDKRLFPYSN
ncbi:MAG: RES family NAD+ phosphorylase [Bacteroidota bacterium]|nr:RES family NAD+ phosphorylase [Bacteroidota bacterium]